MISVIMSGGGNNSPFDSDREIDAVEEPGPRVLIFGGQKLSFSVNSSSIASEEKGISGVSMHADENAGVSDGDVSLVVDFRGSEEVGRVSEGVVEVNEFRVCEIKNADEKLENDEFVGEGFGATESDSQIGEDAKVQSFSEEIDDRSDAPSDNSGRKDRYGTESGYEYDLMLSMFDHYAGNGKSEAVGYGYEIGDMVWGKVKSHPWWPGHIFNDGFASPSVRRSKREGHVLVAFFGDSSYGWFDPAELTPFEPNFDDKSRQTNSRTFVKAVEDALEEVNRRQGLGLACKCRNQFNFRCTNAEGYFAVDVGDYEPGFYSVGQIKKARESFQPRRMLDFVTQLALSPMNHQFEIINLLKNRATVSAFRKAVFEEFDETYAQAFGAHSSRHAARTAPVEPSRVPLSGPLVIAEALGKGKGSLKPNKLKDQLEKDKYLFKRRDEPNESKPHRIIHGQTHLPSLPAQRGGSVVALKGMFPAAVDHASQTSMPKVAEGLEQPDRHPAALKDLHGEKKVQDSVSGDFHSGVIDAKVAAEGIKLPNDSGTKKGKLHKRPAVDLTFESSVPLEKVKKRKKEISKEKSSGYTVTSAGEFDLESARSVEKIKKRKKEIGLERSSNQMLTPVVAAQAGASVLKADKPVEVPSDIGDNSPVKHLGNDDVARTSVAADFGTNLIVADKKIQLELPQLLNDLRALALNPSHGSESIYPAILVQVFLRFRSLVYQKSLSLLASGENEPKEGHGILPSPAASLDNPPENLREVSSVKPPKPPLRLEDPTRGGRKRAPSDRQEEMTLKKKKKMNDLKLLTTEKKAVKKAPEVERGDVKEMSAKTIAQTQEKKAVSRPLEVQPGDGREINRKNLPTAPVKISRSECGKKRELPARAAEPTMLVMKLPPEAALPSPAELKVKFARFGPLDHSGTRIFWKSSTIRLVYRHKIDAQAALKFATSSSNLFGNTNVRCHLRDLGAETPETESTTTTIPPKVEPHIGVSQSKEPPVLQQRQALNAVSQPLPQPVQLKSCLKKLPGDEGTAAATVGGNGNSNSRGRVKFMLGDEGSVRTSSSDDGASSHGLNYNSEKIHMVIRPPASIIPVSTQQIPLAPNNFHHTELVVSRNVQGFVGIPPTAAPALQQPPPPSLPTHIDISQQMLSLLAMCEDVVNNLTSALGYIPYHRL